MKQKVTVAKFSTMIFNIEDSTVLTINIQRKKSLVAFD